VSQQPRVALVVGAGDYIGAAIAKRFAAGGFTVALGRRHAEKLEPLVAEIAASGGAARAFALDARDEANVQEVFATVEKELGPLEVVVFNVGANVSFPITETTSRVFRKVWEMACLGGFLTGREAARAMLPRRRGSIFFTGATASLRGGRGFSAFAGGKHAVRALAQSMARELDPQNIHVAHVVIDGAIDTEFIRSTFPERATTGTAR
jgi:NAD(P)-dependent dehydrogenase (short-subunit alcohol dehydrogenase family)